MVSSGYLRCLLFFPVGPDTLSLCRQCQYFVELWRPSWCLSLAWWYGKTSPSHVVTVDQNSLLSMAQLSTMHGIGAGYTYLLCNNNTYLFYAKSLFTRLFVWALYKTFGKKLLFSIYIWIASQQHIIPINIS